MRNKYNLDKIKLNKTKRYPIDEQEWGVLRVCASESGKRWGKKFTTKSGYFTNGKRKGEFYLDVKRIK